MAGFSRLDQADPRQVRLPSTVTVTGPETNVASELAGGALVDVGNRLGRVQGAGARSARFAAIAIR
jgi:hypothetical protein